MFSAAARARQLVGAAAKDVAERAALPIAGENMASYRGGVMPTLGVDAAQVAARHHLEKFGMLESGARVLAVATWLQLTLNKL